MEKIIGKYVPQDIQNIVSLDIPNILLEYGKQWNYYIIGGRSYNLLMKIPIFTLDYDIKFDLPLQEVFSIRDFIAKKIKEKNQELIVEIEDIADLARISVTVDNIKYDIIDCGAIGEEHIKEKYDIRKNFIVGPNRLRYGGLGYLLIRLEELTELRRQEVNVVLETKDSYSKISKDIKNVVKSNIIQNNFDKKTLLTLEDYINNYGKSSESDEMIGKNISVILTKITDYIIERYDLDDMSDYQSFIDSGDKKKWINKKRPNGIDLSNPLDVVITLFYAEEIYTSSNVINSDLDEKKDKYIRTKDRLNNLKDGLNNPYIYYSNFFIEFLKNLCGNKKSLQLFLIDNFDCNLIK